jgi:membrane protease YdiL (CAAX protease family)
MGRLGSFSGTGRFETAGLALLVVLTSFAGGIASMLVVARYAEPFGFRTMLVLTQIALVAPAVFAGLAARGRLRGVLEAPWPSWAQSSRAVVLGLAFWVLSLGIFEAQNVLSPPPPGFMDQFRDIHAMLRPRSGLELLASLVAISLAPALCEEALFRGVLTPALVHAGGRTLSVLVSAILFAGIHVDSVGSATVFYRVPFAFVFGILLADLRLGTGSLVPPVLAHATVNATTFLVSPFLDDPGELAPPSRPGMALLLLLAGGLATRWARRLIQRMSESGFSPQSSDSERPSSGSPRHSKRLRTH